MSLPSGLIPHLYPNQLHLIILPTEQCNFRCSYCYESFDIGRMKRSTVLAIERLLDRRLGDVEGLRLDWFGGEPLLARDIVVNISQYAQSQCALRDRSYHASITTNASLLDSSTLEQLLIAGVTDYQITLDGVAEAHDRVRKLRSGAGTFDTVYRNLKGLLCHPSPALSVTVRLHLHGTAPEALQALIARLEDDGFLNDHRFDFMVKTVERLGGHQDDDIVPIEHGSSLNKFINDTVASLNRGISTRRVVSADVGPYICYAARPTSFVVRADGRVGKCTVALSDVRNDVGVLRDDGSIQLDADRVKVWMRGLLSGDENELACPLDGLRPDSGPVPVKLLARKV